MLKRVLLKISGEGLCSTNGFGIDKVELESIASVVKKIANNGVELAIVIGAGNIVRGKQLCELGMGRAKSDNIGMLATIINALALQDELERQNVSTKVLSSFFVQQIVEPFVLSNCIEHLKNKRVVILAGGTGSPYFTTDTAAALRAAEIKADRLLKATKVDGVYSDDPLKEKDATKFERLSYMDVLNKNLQVMDLTAITLCMENDIPIVVFSIKEIENVINVINEVPVGTYIGRDQDAC